MALISAEIIEKIKDRIGPEHVLEQEPMKNHSYMEVGGPAAFLFTPGNEEELAFLIRKLKEAACPYYVIGKGTNILFRDEGYQGAIIKILDRFKGISIEGERAVVGAGETNKDVAEALCEASLAGFEFASGIPGCIGGGVSMNAGAYDGEMKDVVEDVTVLKPDGSIETLPAEQMRFSYRNSAVFEEGYIVLKATLKLHKGDQKEIRAQMEELKERRESKQPLEYPSCGSVFKRPVGYFAGGLITEAGLKGTQIGGAQVSEKHAGFIINKGGATAQDVLDLIDLIKKKVYENSGVELVCEVKVL